MRSNSMGKLFPCRERFSCTKGSQKSSSTLLLRLARSNDAQTICIALGFVRRIIGTGFGAGLQLQFILIQTGIPLIE